MSQQRIALWLVGLAFAAPGLCAQGASSDDRTAANPVNGASETPRCGNAALRDSRIPPKVKDWALVWGSWEMGGWTDVLSKPDPDAHRIAQALLGDRVEVFRQRGNWVQTRELGGAWQGWVRAAHLTYGSDSVRRSVETMPTVALAASPYVDVDGCGNRAPFGSRLPLATESATRRKLQLPDGRKLSVNRSDVVLPWRPKPLELTLPRVNALLRRPFQAGGNSPEAIDGAGLVFLVLRASGYDVPREPNSLWALAMPVRRRAMQPGDVLFFEAFGGQPLRPAILVTESVLLEASPASGVNFIPLEQLARRRLQGVRRFATPSPFFGRELFRAPDAASRSAPANAVGLLPILVVLVSQQAVLIALLFVLRAVTLDYVDAADTIVVMA